MGRLPIYVNSILFKLIVTFLLIILPLVIMGIALFSWEKQTLQAQIEANEESNVSYIENMLSEEIRNVRLLQFNIANDRTIKKLITEFQYIPVYEYYTMINDTIRRLQVLKESNICIQDVVLYIPEMKCTLSAGKGYQENLDTEEYSRLLAKYAQSRYPVIVDESGMYALMPFPLGFQDNGANTAYLVEVELSYGQIEYFLSRFNNYQGGFTSLYDLLSKSKIWNTDMLPADQSDSAESSVLNADGQTLTETISLNGKQYFKASCYSSYLNWVFSQYIPIKDVFSVPDRFGYLLWIYAFLCFVVMAVYSYSTHKLVKHPMNKIVEAFRELEKGNFHVKIKFKAAREFNYLYGEFNNMMDRLNLLVENVYKQKLFTQKAELKQLQSQINPHFLYNSYFMLYRMIADDDKANAEMLASYLGTYFQFITRNAHEEVPLHMEVEHAKCYAGIQQMRFSKSLAVEFSDIPDTLRSVCVLRMILQPIVENSLEHGLNGIAAGGLVRITFEEKNNGFVIRIEDNSPLLTDADIEALQGTLSAVDDTMEITGMLNVHRRIALRYGTGSGLSVSRSGLGGLMTEIAIFWV